MPRGLPRRTAGTNAPSTRLPVTTDAECAPKEHANASSADARTTTRPGGTQRRPADPGRRWPTSAERGRGVRASGAGRFRDRSPSRTASRRPSATSTPTPLGRLATTLSPRRQRSRRAGHHREHLSHGPGQSQVTGDDSRLHRARARRRECGAALSGADFGSMFFGGVVGGSVLRRSPTELAAINGEQAQTGSRRAPRLPRSAPS